MLGAIKTFNDEAFDALDAGVPVEEIKDIDAAPRLNRINVQEDYEEYVDELESEISDQLRALY
jgi:V/A-type H+-transporting ATPase subunit A